MPIRQEDLPELSRHHYSVADALARKTISREDFEVTDLKLDENGRIIWVNPLKGDTPLHGLVLLGRVRDLDTYRASKDRKVTASNVLSVARIGGFATAQVYNQAQRRGTELSLTALQGIHETLDIVNQKMRFAFEGMARPIQPDREAVFFMAAIAKKLQESR